MSAVKIPVQQKLFSPQEAAIILCRSLSSIWRDIGEGRLTKVKIGGSTRVTGASIDKMVAGEGSDQAPSRSPNPKLKPKGERRIPIAAAPVEPEQIGQSRKRAVRKVEPVAP